MVSLDSTVDVLEGCGPKRKEILSHHGIYTLRDLLQCTKIIPKVNMVQLKARAQEILKGKPQAKNVRTLSEHSWFERSLHICSFDPTKRREILRVLVGDLIVEPHRLVFAVTYTRGGRKKMRFVSPYHLLLLHLLWQSEEVVSEDTENEEEEILSAPPSTHPYLYPLVFSETEIQPLNETETAALKFMSKEINMLIHGIQNGPQHSPKNKEE